jgi:hypothetical protein
MTRIFRNYANSNPACFCDDLNKFEWEGVLNPTVDTDITVRWYLDKS